MSITTLEMRHVHVLLTGTVTNQVVSIVPNSLPRFRITEPKMLADSRWNGRWIQASPYEEDCHLTDLDPLDVQSQLFALALMHLRNVDEQYRDSPYEEALNWPDVMDKLQILVAEAGIEWKSQKFYVVEFRSTLRENIDTPLLYRLDRQSHQEAAESGGLLKYWYGTPDSKRRNLATCLWRNKQDAFRGSQGPQHRQARAIIPEMYEDINVKGFHLSIGDSLQQWEFLKD